jgi:site-specific recombinase XerD
MHDQHYTDSTLDSYLARLRKVVVWLGRRRITTLAQLTQKDLQAAHDHFLPSQRKAGSVIGAFKRFLSERRLVSQGNWPLPSPVEVEVERFGAYLRETRGAAEKTIACRGGQLRAFLRFLRFDGKPVALRQLELRRVEAFMRESARTNNRSSMQQVVAAVRAYLKERHAQGGAVSTVASANRYSPGVSWRTIAASPSLGADSGAHPIDRPFRTYRTA